MKRKAMLRLLILIMLFILTVSFASCGKESSGDEENGCAHEYSVRITKEPTCDNAGVIIYTCSLCRDTLSESIPALGHSEVPHEGKAASCSERGWEPYVTCNHEGCGYTTYKAIQFLECIPENGRCKLCGISCTAGLMFSYNHKNNSYTLTGIGSATDEDIYIPRIYCGLPVMEIADYAFRSCKTAKSITIPETVESIGTDAFGGTVALQRITVDEKNTAYKDINGNLYSKNGETLYHYPHDKADITFEIPNGVKTIGKYAFSASKRLEKIILPNSVAWIDEAAFCACTALTYVELGSGLKHIGEMAFGGCNRLSDITLPEGISGIGDGAFGGCTSLTRITLPKGVVNIGDYAFEHCIKLTDITLPSSVIHIGSYAFSGCEALREIQIPDRIRTIGTDAFLDCNALLRYEYENGYYIGNESNPYLVLMEAADRDAAELLINEGTKIIYSRALLGLAALRGVTVPESVTAIGDLAFADCTALTEIKIPDSVVNIGKGILSGCTALRGVYISSNISSVSESTFEGCTALTEITIPKWVTYIGQSAFRGCKSLVNISLPEELRTIYESAFEGCVSLRSIAIPERVSYVGRAAFAGCRGLVSVMLPDFVTDISEMAFAGCTNLTSVIISSCVRRIYDYAFFDCPSLKFVYYLSNLEDWESIAIGLYNSDLTDAAIYTYSLNMPEEEGNYWYYSEEGEIVIW